MTTFIFRKALPHAWSLLVGLCTAVWCPAGLSSTEAPPRDRPITYSHDVVPEVPLSIHVIRVARDHGSLVLTTALGKGDVFGMGTVSDQLKALPAQFGVPVAAVNGDFYVSSRSFQGRPRDLQIRRGEVLTSPAGHACFWLGPDGSPHITNVISRFRVVWPGGSETPMGLNEERGEDAVVLYTSVAGASTHTSDGVDLVLEPANKDDWLPLRPGRSCVARVRQVRPEGDTRIEPGLMVLSVGPGLRNTLPPLQPGVTTLTLMTETIPNLPGVETAIGGGPALVLDGKAQEWSGLFHLRHPRTAVGWNKEYVFLVQVDGRQRNLSVGMTFAELADYLVKLGCREAMNLDGGGSSTLWAFGNVQNSPSEGQERPGANALVVLKKPATK